jgi:hypothetical protein
MAEVVSAQAPAPPYASPRDRGIAAIAIVIVSSTGFAALILQALFGPPLVIPARDMAARTALVAMGLGSLAAYGGLPAGAVALAMWTHRCCRNLPSLGRRSHLPPAWAAAGWLVPVANLVVPWVALQDVASGSGVFARGRLLVHAWWLLWLAAVATLVGGGLVPSRDAGAVAIASDALLAGAGVLLAGVVAIVTRRQEERAPAL